MTIVKHTPGPWSVSWKDSRQQSDYYWEVPIRVGAESNAGNSLCRVYMGGDGAIYSNKEVVEANARLIAAAPELLKALKWAMKQIGEPRLVRGQNDEHFNAWHAAKDALAKAEGRSNAVRKES